MSALLPALTAGSVALLAAARILLPRCLAYRASTARYRLLRAAMLKACPLNSPAAPGLEVPLAKHIFIEYESSSDPLRFNIFINNVANNDELKAAQVERKLFMEILPALNLELGYVVPKKSAKVNFDAASNVFAIDGLTMMEDMFIECIGNYQNCLYSVNGKPVSKEDFCKIVSHRDGYR
jgi:hypothetical protein